MAHRQILLVNSLSDDSIRSPINGTNIFEFKTEPILPDFILWIYVATIVVFGGFLNFIVFAALLKSKSNGTSVFIIQLILNDITSLAIASIELLYMNNRKWIFYPEMCPMYLGLESITSTATVYFIISINLHAISTHNLAAKTIIDRELQTQIDPPSDDDNYEVAACTQQRSLKIDYCKRKDRISVMFPILFIWFLAASVSIPLITFGMLIPNDKTAYICGIENVNQGTNIVLQLLVLHIRIIIPFLCLMITTLCVAYKFWFYKSVTCQLHENVNSVLKLGLALSIGYILFSTQRVYGSLMFEIMRKPFMQYKYPIFGKLTSVVFCMINYAIPAVRPLIYICIDKTVRRKVNVCHRNKKIDVICVMAGKLALYTPLISIEAPNNQLAIIILVIWYIITLNILLVLSIVEFKNVNVISVTIGVGFGSIIYT